MYSMVLIETGFHFESENVTKGKSVTMATEMKMIKIVDIAVDHEWNSRIMDTDKVGQDSMELPSSREDAKKMPMVDLINSIKESGQLSPILVRRLPPKSDKPYALVAGFRRLTAMATIGKTEINALIMDIDERTAAMLNAAENEQRKDLEPYELAVTCKRLFDKYGYTKTEIAEKLGRSQSYVNSIILNLELVHPKILDAWAGRSGDRARKAAKTDNLVKWRNLPKEEQLAKFEEMMGDKTGKGEGKGKSESTAEGAGENGGEKSPDGAPKLERRTKGEFQLAYDFFASDSVPDTMTFDEVETIKRTLDWATGRATKLLGIDLNEFAKAKKEQEQAKRSAFEKWMSDPNTLAKFQKAYEDEQRGKNVKNGNPPATGGVATPVTHPVAPSKDVGKDAGKDVGKNKPAK
jgi:ParB/RepB/Spo0J family partition protein